MQIISRSEAQKLGASRYFTGTPCTKGHVAPRTVADWTCTECKRIACRGRKQPGRKRDIEKRRKHIAANLEKYRAYWRKAKGYPAATRPIPNSCECCGVKASTLAKELSLDHCHETGQFRGWLCSPCNRAIGMVGDSIEGVLKALVYLVRHGNKADPHAQLGAELVERIPGYRGPNP